MSRDNGDPEAFMPAVTHSASNEETTAGSYFVSNYPPYSLWSADNVADARAALKRPPRPNTPLGIRQLGRRLATALNGALGLRIPVSCVAPGALPRFETKARRWIRR